MRGNDLESICWRVKRIREVFGDGKNQAEYADLLGIGAKSWPSYENDERISLNSALKVVMRHKEVTLNWIYLGDSRGMAFDVIRELEGKTASPSIATKRGSGKRT